MKRHQQGELLPMVKFREIIRLYEMGHSQCEIARSCLVARSTVQDYIRRATAKELTYAQLSSLSDSDAQKLLGKGKRKHSSQAHVLDFQPVHLELQHKGVTLALIWQEGIEAGQWHCSYGSFCRRYQQWRGQQNLSMRQVYKGGDKLFVDYCGPTIEVQDPNTGEKVSAQIFVACLGASNYTFAEATPTQGLPHWIGSHQRALEFFGGVPAVIVPDNLKSGVKDPCRYEPGINRTYQDFAEHYQVAVMPARPHKPRDKAKVEKAVQEVERQILAKLRHQTFTSFSQLNDVIREHLATLNDRTMQSYGLSRQTLFERVDQPELAPLPTAPFILAHWKQAKVNLDYHIEVERHYYSVPYWLVRHQVTVKRTENLIEIFHDHQRIALHERSGIPHRHSTKPEHMPPEHWAYKSQSKEQFLAWAQRIGPHTTQQVEAIFDRKPYEEQAFRTLKGVQRLATDHGAVRLEAACHRANTLAMVGLRHLRSMLKTHLETAPLPVDVPHIIPVTHANVRGQDYYT